MKKISKILFIALFSVFAISPVFADADDTAWINKCIADNKDEGQTSETVKTYCTCMNGYMSSSETASITSWEKTHPKENEDCSKKAGWTTK